MLASLLGTQTPHPGFLEGANTPGLQLRFVLPETTDDTAFTGLDIKVKYVDVGFAGLDRMTMAIMPFSRVMAARPGVPRGRFRSLLVEIRVQACRTLGRLRIQFARGRAMPCLPRPTAA